jgi:hypothetical protein
MRHDARRKYFKYALLACPNLALFGSAVMSDCSPECAPKRTSADLSEFMGSHLKGFSKRSRMGHRGAHSHDPVAHAGYARYWRAVSLR